VSPACRQAGSLVPHTIIELYYGRGGKFTLSESFILFRKFKAPTIFNGNELLNGKTLVTALDGTIIDLIEASEAGDDVEAFDGILCPGFVNCHCHLELSHMKGVIPEHTGLVDFVIRVVNERYPDEEKIMDAINNAERDMIQNGIVAVGDICNNLYSLAQKKKRNLTYHNFIEASGFSPAVAESRFQRSLDFYTTYAAELPANSIVPHAPYSVSPELFGMIVNFPGNHLLTIHNQEEVAENQFFQTLDGDFLRMYRQMNIDISFFKSCGKSSLQVYLPYFNNDQSLILVHNVVTSEADLAFIKKSNGPEIFFCFCPLANLYIGNKLPDVNLFMKYQGKIVLGTDSLASNHQLNILEEMKVLQSHFPKVGLSQLLQWATFNGAKALGIQNNYGSFEKGKKPGIVWIDHIAEMKLSPASKAKRIL